MNIGACLLVGASWSSAIAVSVIVRTAIRGAAQPAIVVGDVAAAAPKIIELGIAPISVARLATSPQIVTRNPDITAGLAIGSARPPHVVIIVTPAARVSHCGAAQATVIITDIATASVPVVKPCIAPVAISLLAAGEQIIAAYFNVTASL